MPMQSLRTRELALRLASFESITDGPGEMAFGPFLAGILRASPAFVGAPDRVRVLDTLDDTRRRAVVFGLVRGSGRATVLLTGHYDVVGTEAYGNLRPLAFDPAALTSALKVELKVSRETAHAQGREPNQAEELALADLESEDFVAGRGLLDMKAGLAAGIAVLEGFASEKAAIGNLLFMAVPDEEGASHGMRSAVRLLPALLAEWGLELLLAINLDSAVDAEAGASARAIFLGSVGKTHPFVLFRGRPSHAGAPFDGVNACLMAAEFVREVESSPALLGSTVDSREEQPPPPTVLYHRDLRNSYEVTSPSSVFTSLNVLTHEAGPLEVLERVGGQALSAMERTKKLLAERAAEQARLSGIATKSRAGEGRLLYWSELARLARKRDEPAFDAARLALRNSADAIPALATFVDACVDIASVEGPVAIVGLAPPYYPRAAFDPADAQLAKKIADFAEAFSRASGCPIVLRRFFPGISDMSYLSPADMPDARAEAAAESPLGVEAATGGFYCPAVNVGPWGRDYHQRLERLHASYAFETLPRLVALLSAKVLE